MAATTLAVSKAAGFSSLVFRSIGRGFGTSSTPSCTEIEVSVPWGKIAGKLWNANDTQPILALHGWQDNAASFDKLVPHLPEKTSVLAIDFAGHGLSSWIQPGMPYTKMLYIQVIHRIRRHFGLDKVGLIGHSLGGISSFQYAALFPEDVKFVVGLDYFQQPVKRPEIQAPRLAGDLDVFLRLEKANDPPIGYTVEETIAKLLEITEHSLDESACRALMARGFTAREDGKLCINRDPRVKFGDLTLATNLENLRVLGERVTSPFMVIKAENWHYNGDKSGYLAGLETLKKSSADFRYFRVPGKHHFHMIDPRSTAELMIPFLEKYH